MAAYRTKCTGFIQELLINLKAKNQCGLAWNDKESDAELLYVIFVIAAVF